MSPSLLGGSIRYSADLGTVFCRGSYLAARMVSDVALLKEIRDESHRIPERFTLVSECWQARDGNDFGLVKYRYDLIAVDPQRG